MNAEGFLGVRLVEVEHLGGQDVCLSVSHRRSALASQLTQNRIGEAVAAKCHAI